MKSTKTFNNISDKLKKEIPVLKPGEIVTFQMLNGTPNPEPDEKERSKNPYLYGKMQIPTSFRIFDPYVKDESGAEVGGYVDVGAVEQWNGEQPVKFRMLVPGMGEYSQFQGKFSLSAGNIRDMELYEILWLSNQREGNPHRDTSVEPLFKILNAKADSVAMVNKFTILQKALDYVKTITEEKAREIFAALNKPVYQDKDVLMAQVKDFASSEPDTFIKTYEAKDTSLKALVSSAIAGGVIVHDLPTGEVRIGKTVITTMKSGTAEAFISEFSAWLSTAKNGEDVTNNIKAQLGKKEELPA